jgi:hypothetical protein
VVGVAAVGTDIMVETLLPIDRQELWFHWRQGSANCLPDCCPAFICVCCPEFASWTLRNCTHKSLQSVRSVRRRSQCNATHLWTS